MLVASVALFPVPHKVALNKVLHNAPDCKFVIAVEIC